MGFVLTANRPRLPDVRFLICRITWLVCSAFYIVVYRALADLAILPSHTFLIDATILLQAIVLPVYAQRAFFASLRESVIRTAAFGVAFSALPGALILQAARAHRLSYESECIRMQTGYPSAILLLAGLINGSLFAILAWKGFRNAASTLPFAPSASRWIRWAKSAVLWIAAVTLCAWVANLFRGTYGSPVLAYFSILLALPGIFLIAPIAAFISAGSDARWGNRIWKYASRSFLVVAIGVGGYVLLAMILAGPLILLYIGGIVVLGVPALCIPCLIWSILSAFVEAHQNQPPSAVIAQTPLVAWLASVAPTWALLLLALASQSFIFLPAVLTTSPPALGFQGIGCTSSSFAIPADYWFWQAYKGVRSRSESSNRVVFRPATDSKTCVVVDKKFLSSWNDPKQKTLGYAEAARSWFWLVDPDRWDSPRTKDIRTHLTTLLGVDSSSYIELQEWWTANGANLVWSGTDELLAVHEPTPSDLGHSYQYRLDHPPTSPSAVEQFRLHPYLAGSLVSPDKVEDIGAFHATLYDREARLRGLELAASDNVAVLNGERDRNARKFLESLTGKRFATKREWDYFFASNPPPPWKMSRVSAKEWIGLIGLYGQTSPYRGRYVEKLGEQTGLDYSTPEEFIPWLENPENTRQEEWLKGRDMLGDLYGENPAYSLNQAMSVLKMVTTQSFDSPDRWIAWWQANRQNLVLSRGEDKLVVVSSRSN